MSQELRKVRRQMLREVRKTYPWRAPEWLARHLVVIQGRDGSYTGYLKEGRRAA